MEHRSQRTLMKHTMRWIIPISLVILLLLIQTREHNAFVLSTNIWSSRCSSGTCSSSLLFDSSPITTTTGLNEEEDTSVASTSSKSPFLPDYGKTPVEIDQIQIIKKKWRRPELYGQSLIEQTLQGIIQIGDGTNTDSATTKEERRAQRRSLQQASNVPNFEQYVHTMAGSVSSAKSTTTQQPQPTDTLQLLNRKNTPTILQINIGLYCNQACQHCHVESSPLRTQEMMTMDVILQCLTILQNTPSITTLDITGGAPELHEHFRYLVSMARTIRPNPNDFDIIDRCNLTVLYEPNQGQELIDFLLRNHVHIIASLPCYSEENVNTQRGNNVFERSIAALLALNDAGYGITTSSSSTTDIEKDLNIEVNADDTASSTTTPKYKLDLVYNPAGAFLPPPQDKLQVQYKEQLLTNFGIVFDELYTITNMPIQRFADYLYRRNELIDYMDLLVRNYNPATIENVMCQNTISIRYDGIIYDCDFNQQLDIPILTSATAATATNENMINDNDDTVGPDTTSLPQQQQQQQHQGINCRRPLTVFDISSLDDIQLYYNKIRTDIHCFGCTAGMGSSCQGTTAVDDAE